MWEHFNHSIDYDEQGIIGKNVSAPAISNENLYLICISSGGNIGLASGRQYHGLRCSIMGTFPTLSAHVTLWAWHW
jgi:hypothetical protein